MDSVTAILMMKALDGLSARTKVTAENIANAGTPGYRPMRVSFEQALADAASIGTGALRGVEPELHRAAAGTPDAELRVDLELANASATSGRYTALVELLDRQMRIDALAIKGSY